MRTDDTFSTDAPGRGGSASAECQRKYGTALKRYTLPLLLGQDTNATTKGGSR